MIRARHVDEISASYARFEEADDTYAKDDLRVFFVIEDGCMYARHDRVNDKDQAHIEWMAKRLPSAQNGRVPYKIPPGYWTAEFVLPRMYVASELPEDMPGPIRHWEERSE